MTRRVASANSPVVGPQYFREVRCETITVALEALQRHVQVRQEPPAQRGIAPNICCARQAGEPPAIVLDQKRVAFDGGLGHGDDPVEPGRGTIHRGAALTT